MTYVSCKSGVLKGLALTVFCGKSSVQSLSSKPALETFWLFPHTFCYDFMSVPTALFSLESRAAVVTSTTL